MPHSRGGRFGAALLVMMATAVASGCGDDADVAAGSGTRDSADETAGSDTTTELVHVDDQDGEAVDDEIAEALAARSDLVPSDGDVSRIEMDYLTEWDLLRVIDPDRSHFETFYLGFDGERALVVTGDTEAFDQMVAADGTGVADAEVALELVKTRIEVARSASFVTLTSSVDDIDYEPARQAVSAELAAEIAPPAVDDRPAGGWIVTVYTIGVGNCEDEDNLALERHQVEVNADGGIDREEVDVLAELPSGVTFAPC